MPPQRSVFAPTDRLVGLEVFRDGVGPWAGRSLSPKPLSGPVIEVLSL